MSRTSQKGDLNGFIDAGSYIEGSLHFEDTFRLDGRLKGKVVSTGDLVVGDHGDVEADIEVSRIFVSGTVRGSISAKQRVEIAASGKVYADLETPSLVVEDGAVLQGQCNMARDGGAQKKPVAKQGGGKVTRMPLSAPER